MEECVFCDLVAGEHGFISLAGTLIIEPLNPVTPGHRIFIPEKHVRTADEDPRLTGLIFSEAASYAKAMRLSKSDQQDFNLIVNAGEHASQTIGHLHIHYVPRRKDDGLKLPWTDQLKGEN